MGTSRSFFMSRTSKKILGISAATLALAVIVPSAAYAENDGEIATVSSSKNEKCIDTSSLEAYNASITQNRVVFPMDAGTYRISSTYGPRSAPVAGAINYHYGNDFSAAAGTPIYAVAAGTVVRNDIEIGGGHWVVIEHEIDGQVYTSEYNHMLAYSQTVKPGQKVQPGDKIGLVGTTGLSTGNHLHFEVWKGPLDVRYTSRVEDPIDSLKWLKDHGATYRNDEAKTLDLTCDTANIKATNGVSWDEHPNGEIPGHNLKTVNFAEGKELSLKPAQALEKLNEEFKKEFGEDLTVMRAYENLDAQKKNPLEIPGKSIYGWGQTVSVSFTQAANTYIPLISEPDYFTDPQYKWLLENAKKFGWNNPQENRKDGKNPDPHIWVYSEETAGYASKNALTEFTRATSISYAWNSDGEQKCAVDLFGTTGWDTSKKSRDGKESGIAMLNSGQVKAYSADPAGYRDNGRNQIATGLEYITDKYGSPCKALTQQKNNGGY